MTKKPEKEVNQEIVGPDKPIAIEAKSILEGELEKDTEELINHLNLFSSIVKKIEKTKEEKRAINRLKFERLKTQLFTDFFIKKVEEEVVGRIVYGAIRETATNPDKKERPLIEISISKYGLISEIPDEKGQWLINKENKELEKSVVEIHYLVLKNLLEDATAWSSSYPEAR